ncbi:TetR/AcrR family transcriptional regulator [Streptomyces sp. NPDC091279]|uniref:TetR/AcrR family transcriptional regulator n=1 Tax=Streptomyces sp. NPDC091279 TaxID=3365983 RepID=UPI0037F32915
MTDLLPHPLRSDARDNRDRILDAARALFPVDGLNVPMREIARHAGVGPATLYRRFPTKRDLVTEAFADHLHACRVIVEEGSADPDPWRGLGRVIERLCELHARDGEFTEALLSEFPDATDLAADRAATLRASAALVRRAKDAGRLRPDVVLDDLILMVTAVRGIRTASTAARIRAARRYAGFVVRALAA